MAKSCPLVRFDQPVMLRDEPSVAGARAEPSSAFLCGVCASSEQHAFSLNNPADASMARIHSRIIFWPSLGAVFITGVCIAFYFGKAWSLPPQIVRLSCDMHSGAMKDRNSEH
jgi:hypothetical protein